MKIGFIGTGNMASAIIKGLISQNLYKATEICTFSLPDPQRDKFISETGITLCANNSALVSQSEIVILAVKPQLLPHVMEEIRQDLALTKPLLISIAAGTSLSQLENMAAAPQPLHIIRVMPNLNAAIGCSASAVCGNTAATAEEIATVLNIFQSVGKAWTMPEKDFSTFAAIAGCSPAYAFLFIDSLARAAVKNGLPKKLAEEIATQAVLGSAKLLQQTAENPWTLIDKVCSPGGTTIAGLVALEDNAFISTIIKGIQAAIDKDQDLLSKNN